MQHAMHKKRGKSGHLSSSSAASWPRQLVVGCIAGNGTVGLPSLIESIERSIDKSATTTGRDPVFNFNLVSFGSLDATLR